MLVCAKFSQAASIGHILKRCECFADNVQDDEGYYNPPGGLLSLDLHLGSLLEQARHLDVDSTEDPITLDSFVPHFNLVNAQLSQVRLPLPMLHPCGGIFLTRLESMQVVCRRDYTAQTRPNQA